MQSSYEDIVAALEDCESIYSVLHRAEIYGWEPRKSIRPVERLWWRVLPDGSHVTIERGLKAYYVQAWDAKRTKFRKTTWKWRV